MPKQDIISTLVGFYDKDEVVEAKQTLFRSVNEFDPKVSDSPRLKTRSKAPNKRRLDCQDVMGLLVFLDKRQLMDNLPKFYAADLNRVPRIAPTEVDSVRLVETVGDLREQLCTLTAQFQELKSTSMTGVKMDGSSNAMTIDLTPAAAVSTGRPTTTDNEMYVF